MAKVFSRQKRHPFAASEADPPIPQSVTMEQWNGMQDTQELPPPKQPSPSRSKATTTTNSSFDDAEDPEDFGLSCTGLLGEEVLLDTGFGEFARRSLEATADSLKKLSEAVVFHKSKEPDDAPIIVVDNSELLRENERLKRENTWLQEENQSLRGGTYREEEEDVLSTSV